MTYLVYNYIRLYMFIHVYICLYSYMKNFLSGDDMR